MVDETNITPETVPIIEGVDPVPYDPQTFGRKPELEDEDRPLTYRDFCVLDERLERIEARLTVMERAAVRRDEVHTRLEIEGLVRERKQEIADSEHRQYKHVEKVLNEIGTRFEKTVKGLTDTVAQANIRYSEVIDLNKDTASLAQQGLELAKQALEATHANAATVSAWNPIVNAIGNRASAAEAKAERLEGRVQNISDIQGSSEERMTRYVARWEDVAEDVKRHEIEIDTLQAHYQSVAISTAQSAAAVTTIQNTFSPRNVLSAMIVFASLIGLDSGAIQQAFENFSKLFGG